MARALRIEFLRAEYHVTSRGNAGRDIARGAARSLRLRSLRRIRDLVRASERAINDDPQPCESSTRLQETRCRSTIPQSGPRGSDDAVARRGGAIAADDGRSVLCRRWLAYE